MEKYLYIVLSFSRVNAKLADLSKVESLNKPLQPLTSPTETLPMSTKVAATLQPLGGGRSIRKKPGTAAEQKIDDFTHTIKAMDEMQQAVAAGTAAAQSQTPFLMNNNAVSSMNIRSCKSGDFILICIQFCNRRASLLIAIRLKVSLDFCHTLNLWSIPGWAAAMQAHLCSSMACKC
jgi:hypothetical protein